MNFLLENGIEGGQGEVQPNSICKDFRQSAKLPCSRPVFSWKTQAGARSMKNSVRFDLIYGETLAKPQLNLKFAHQRIFPKE